MPSPSCGWILNQAWTGEPIFSLAALLFNARHRGVVARSIRGSNTDERGLSITVGYRNQSCDVRPA